MTKDFSQHHKIIAQFRGHVGQSDFENKFAAATAHIAKTERFLLKMELKRLAGPCMRLIDLRGHVDGECKAYQHETRTHYLDPTAIRVFEENIAQYGEYTFGVYEAVNNTENNFRVIYQKEKRGLQNKEQAPVQKVLEKQQYPASLQNFGPYFDRCEERMNFAVSLSITLADKRKHEVLSSDISVNGCRIRLKGAKQLAIGDKLELEFIGMTQEFQFGDNAIFDYQVKNLYRIDDTQFVGLERIGVINIKKDPFAKFLKGYIQGNKRRYKINLDNTISALQARAFETFTLPKISELPIFIAAKENADDEYVPKYALTCPNNREQCYYWQDEKRQSTLEYLLTPERIQMLIKLSQLGKSLRVYSFKHQTSGKIYFYTVDHLNFKDDHEFLSQFLGYASSKPSFEITDLTLFALDAKHAHAPLALADTLTKKNEYLNTPPSEEVLQIVDGLPFIVVAQSITEPSLVKSYQALSFDNIDMNKVKAFGHRKSKNSALVDEVGINYKNQRHELRFKYDTPAVVTIDGVTCNGHSKDFSTSGLKIMLDKSSVLVKGDIVHIAFPNLQKITSSFDLNELPYEIVRINKDKTLLNLKVHVEKHQHIGRSFFKLLIEKNRNKLTPDEYAFVTPGLAKALRNIYSASIRIPYLAVQISGSRYKAETITCSNEYGRLLPAMKMLSEKRGKYNLYPLLGNPESQAFMTSRLKKMQSSDQPLHDLLYISIRHHTDYVDEAVKVKLESQLESVKLRQMFINSAMKNGDFFAIRVTVARAEEPDMEYLNPELSYIGSYAIHKGKQIEQEIWSVAGVVQLYDITQEVLQRQQLAPNS